MNSLTMVRVASFGHRIDRFLDRWGFEVHTIIQLADAWAFSHTAQAFVEKMNKHGMGGSEAMWFWEEISKEGGIHDTRERAVFDRI